MQLKFPSVLRALAVLLAGFALADSGPGRALGDGVASTLAKLATPLLRLFDPAILRIGTELRGADGWAVRVSEVCDGHGLAIALAASLVGLSGGQNGGLRRFALGLVAIQVFNLARIVVLALVLSRAPGAFDIVHTGVFPLLTVALLALCTLPLPTALPLLAVSLPLVLLWLPLADLASQLLVPPANMILSLVAGPEVGQVAQRAAGWTIGTNLLASNEAGDVRLFVAPLRPADFALGVPLVLAAIALTRRPVWLVPALFSMLTALTIAAVTTVWALAAGQADAKLLVPDGLGAFTPQDFAPPESLRALLRVVQNSLVHLNLLVLPFLIVGGARRHA